MTLQFKTTADGMMDYATGDSSKTHYQIYAQFRGGIAPLYVATCNEDILGKFEYYEHAKVACNMHNNQATAEAVNA